jgi:hypothetical protein
VVGQVRSLVGQVRGVAGQVKGVVGQVRGLLAESELWSVKLEVRSANSEALVVKINVLSAMLV